MGPGMIIRKDVELANASDVGCQREVNEDYYLFVEPQSDEEFARRGRLVVVADGVGGAVGGQVASRLAAHTIRDVFLHSDSVNPRDVLIEGYLMAHRGIQEYTRSHPDLTGMATTCTAAVLRQGQLTLGHIGDSRLYLIRGRRARQLSRDHTVVNQMLEQGEITAEQAAHHERKHVLFAALGTGETLAADFPDEPLDLQGGDVLLFCSDGIHGLISDEELAEVATTQAPPEACRELVAWARARGGPDNITVQIVRMASNGAATVRETPVR
jgi:serine/threonine protein phosphatase PrpC